MLQSPNPQAMLRLAVFIDGGYFDEVGRYYKFNHRRGSRLSLDGILQFVRHQAAYLEDKPVAFCQVTEAHYFRGRFSAESASLAGKLEDERRFDDILIRAGVVQHYLPVDESRQRPVEKGIDVWLSLEAFDLAVHKPIDILVLVACDGEYVPLVRKLNGIGTRTMLLAWDFEYEYEVDGYLRRRTTRTSSELIRAATYPLFMHNEVEEPEDSELVDELFVH